jgi:hypothetical protein
MVGRGCRHLDRSLWCSGEGSVSIPLLPNGFHEKVSLVKVNVVTEAETKAAKRTPLATLPFALSLNLLFGGSVHDGFRPGRALQSKVRPLSRPVPFGAVTATTGPRAFSMFVAASFTSVLVPSGLSLHCSS